MPKNPNHPLVLVRRYGELLQADLAVAGGVTRGYISHIEQGRRRNVSAECLLGIYDTYRSEFASLGLTYEALARGCVSN